MSDPVQSPSSQVVSDGAQVVTVTDSLGRKLTVKRPRALDKMRLFRVLGPDLSMNPAYVGMAMLACSVTEIDGDPVPFPQKQGFVEALVDRIGDEGIEAVAGVLAPDADGVEDVVSAAKNS